MGRGVQQHTKYDNNPLMRGGFWPFRKCVMLLAAGGLLCWLPAGCIVGRAGQDARAVWHGFTVGG